MEMQCKERGVWEMALEWVGCVRAGLEFARGRTWRAWSFTRQIARAYGPAGGLAASGLVPAQVSSSAAFLKRVACPTNWLSAIQHRRLMRRSYARPNARLVWRSTK